MKKMMLLAAAALLSGSALAQTLSLKVPENVPEAAREVLVQRFTQMLQGAGVTVGEEGETLFIEGKVTDRMVTPGSASQTALSIDIRAYMARGGEVLVENTWPVKGVGRMRPMPGSAPPSRSFRARRLRKRSCNS